MKTREIVMGGLLTGLSILIPLLFAGTPLAITVPPFSATIASHVPVLLAMAISPPVAIMVGVGSAIGFALKLPIVIAARALMHALFGGIGAVAYKKGMPYIVVLLLVLPMHALLEALVVLPFGYDFYTAFYVIGVGTILHHIIDSIIVILVYHALIKFSLLKKPTHIGNKLSNI